MTQIKNIFNKSLVLGSIILVSVSCSGTPSATGSQPKNPSPFKENTFVSPVKEAGEISLMTFNVENMFDNTHDEGTFDYTNLPLAEKNHPDVQNYCASITSEHYKKECLEKDWTDEAVEFKLSQIEKTIRFTEKGLGPDIIFLAEVENIKILNRLANTNLKGLGYKSRVLIEGPDTRGIDPAILSKFPVKGTPILHIIPYQESDPEKLKNALKSRGIIEATFILPNDRDLTVMAVHFPSQANPSDWRRQAATFLKLKMQEYQNQGRAVIAGGDFNIIKTEESDRGYFSEILSAVGQVSHFVGCKTCEGTHYHKGEWSFLDVIVVGHKIHKAGLALVTDSIMTVKAPHHVDQNGIPIRFDEVKRIGVSDHLPLYIRLKIK